MSDDTSPAKQIFVAILVTPLAVFALSDLFMVYYQGAGLLPSMPNLLRLVIHGIAAVLILKYVAKAWWYLRTRRIMRFQRNYEMHNTNLASIGKRVTKTPSPLELLAFLALMLAVIAAIHVFGQPSAPFFFLLMVPGIVFYPVIEALLLARWKHKELKHV